MGAAGAVAITAGKVLVDDGVDMRYLAKRMSVPVHRSSMGLGTNVAETLGGVLFVAGWAVILAAATLSVNQQFQDDNDPKTYHFDCTWGNAILLTGLLMMFFATLSKRALDHRWFPTSPSDLPNILPSWPPLYIGLYILSWYAFATTISFKSGSWDVNKLIFGLVAATILAAGEGILFLNRSAGISIQKHGVQGHVYNMGLPLFMAAWFLIIIELSLE